MCCIQRPRSGACFAWGRGFRHCCVAVPKSRGWGADFPWLVHVLWARRGAGGGACTRVPRARIRVCVWALGAPPPAVRGGPVARGVRGRALSPLRLPSFCGLSGPAAHVLWARVCGYGVHCEGRLRSGAPPPPTVRPLGGLSVRLHPCRGRGCAGVGARRCPLGLHALWGPRSAGVVGAVPGGLARHRCEGRLVLGAVPPPFARPLGGPSGSTTHMLWARACVCGGPAPSPRPACPVGAACRGGGGGPPPGGVACHRCEGRLVSDAVPPPAARPLGRLVRVPRPVCPGCGRCGRADTQHRPHIMRPCGPASLAVGVAEGRPRGGAFHGCEGRLMSGAPPPPAVRSLGGLLGSTTHVLWARAWGCGGPTLPPWPACPVGAACRGGGGGPSPGGWPAPVVRGVWCQALSLPRPPVLCGGQLGHRDPCVPGAVGAGVGTQQHAPTACALAGRRCSLWGRRKGVPGGGAFHHCVNGRPRSGAVPPPTVRPLGGLLGSATHVLWARLCGCWGPTLSHWPACPAGASEAVGWGPPRWPLKTLKMQQSTKIRLQP